MQMSSRTHLHRRLGTTDAVGRGKEGLFCHHHLGHCDATVIATATAASFAGDYRDVDKSRLSKKQRRRTEA